MKLFHARPHAIVFSGFLLIACLDVVSYAQQPDAPAQVGPIAIVPLNTSDTVSGAILVTAGTATIQADGSITSGPEITPVVLPRRGMLRVCPSTTVNLSTDTSVSAGETPGLMMALDHGAIEASYAAGRNSDVLLTPDFRILIGGPGAVDVKVRLGDHGDTCVDNPGLNAPYVLVSSVFDGGAYRVQPGQRVMFQRGSLHEVVDQEKEPCGCPPARRPGSNDFPLAESAGLSPKSPPVQPTPKAGSVAAPSTIKEPLVYQAQAPAEAPVPTASAPVPTKPAAQLAQATPQSAPAKKHKGFFHRVGSFFRRIFGADQG